MLHSFLLSFLFFVPLIICSCHFTKSCRFASCLLLQIANPTQAPTAPPHSTLPHPSPPHSTPPHQTPPHPTLPHYTLSHPTLSYLTPRHHVTHHPTQANSTPTPPPFSPASHVPDYQRRACQTPQPVFSTEFNPQPDFYCGPEIKLVELQVLTVGPSARLLSLVGPTAVSLS